MNAFIGSTIIYLALLVVGCLPRPRLCWGGSGVAPVLVADVACPGCYLPCPSLLAGSGVAPALVAEAVRSSILPRAPYAWGDGRGVGLTC